MARIPPFYLTLLFLLVLVVFTANSEGTYYHRPSNYSHGQSQWPSYYAYYGGPAYAAYPYTSAYAYYAPSSYSNYTYPSYPYFGYYYRNNAIIRPPTYREPSDVKQSHAVYIYQTPQKDDEVKKGSGVFFNSN